VLLGGGVKRRRGAGKVEGAVDRSGRLIGVMVLEVADRRSNCKPELPE
jgi:hypothetical protein